MDPSAFLAMSLLGQMTLGELANGYPEVVAELRTLGGVQTAATFSGLLTHPDLQANCIRLEALIHFCLLYSDLRGWVGLAR